MPERTIIMVVPPEYEGREQSWLKHRILAESHVNIHPIHGAFGDHVQGIERIMQDDPAFVFVDPTGFKGAAMEFIKPLLAPRMRDVLINVMYEYANRFTGELDDHLLPFFRIEEEDRAGLSEEQLLALYRRNLKKHCGVGFAADLRVPHPITPWPPRRQVPHDTDLVRRGQRLDRDRRP